MKKLVIIMFSLIVIAGLSACDKDEVRTSESQQQPQQPGQTGNEKEEDEEEEDDNSKENMKLKITVGSAIFTATLHDNAAASEFVKLLPMTVTMSELNNNEKYCDLPMSLPTNSSNPGTIQNGDLMLYGPRTLVLFYKSFPTSYSYTRLGKIENAAGLASALGSGSVTIRFESE